MALVGVLAGACALAWVSANWLLVALAALLAIVLLNHQVYRFFRRQRGGAFALAVIPLHVLYYGYSGLAFAAGSLAHLAARGERGPRPARSQVAMDEEHERRD